MDLAASVTIFYAGLFGLVLLILSLNIFREYFRIALGAQSQNEENWKRAERAQHSFVEFVPLCLLLVFLIEAHGAPRGVLHGLCSMLLVARIFHAYGVGRDNLANSLRLIGTQTTYLVLMISSLACIYYGIVPQLVTLGSKLN